MPTKKIVPTTKIRLAVVDITTTANSILLEGFEGDLKYILMIDADLDKETLEEGFAAEHEFSRNFDWKAEKRWNRYFR